MQVIGVILIEFAKIRAKMGVVNWSLYTHNRAIGFLFFNFLMPGVQTLGIGSLNYFTVE